MTLRLVTLFALVACSLANRDLCPHPDEAKVEYVNQRVAVDAIDANMVTVEMDLESFDITHEIISCVSVVPEEDGWGPVGVALGQNRRGGWSIKLLSAESEGIRSAINVYGPETDNEGPNPDEFAGLLARSQHHMNIKKVHQY